VDPVVVAVQPEIELLAADTQHLVNSFAEPS
jgi:hypothetical protein